MWVASPEEADGNQRKLTGRNWSVAELSALKRSEMTLNHTEDDSVPEGS